MNGRLSSITSGDTTVGFTYDAAGRIATSKQTTAGTEYPFSYNYYLDGSLHTQTYPSGRTLTYGIDLMGRLTSVTGQLGGQTTPYASSATYAAHGGLTSVSLGNGLVENWSYNAARQQPWRIQLGTVAEPNSVDEWLNDYCPTALFAGGSCATNNGNVMAQKVGSLGNAKTVYDYDWINRLLSATESGNGTGWSQTYGYDAHGNRWVSANAGVALSANTPTSLSNYTGTMDNRVTVNNAIHDAAGNQKEIGGFKFKYDAENRVMESAILGNTTVYAYDGEGRRVKKGSTVFVYDAFGKLVAEYGGTASPNQTEYLTADHLGSTRLVTKADGTRDRCYDYLPFGEEIPQGVSGRGNCYPTDGSTPTSGVKFTGKERDQETSLDYFGARYFSGAQGRFASPDAPFADQHLEDPQSWNLYMYTRNNPLRYVDTDGAAVVDAGVVRLGTVARKEYQQIGQSFDRAGLLSTIWAAQIGSNQRSINRNIDQLRQNQSSWWFPTQNNASGGCVLGCIATFSEQAIGYSLNLSFTYDKSDNLSGATITLDIDRSATFIGQNPPPTTTMSTFLSGMTPEPQTLRVDINPGSLKHLTPQQLRALSKAALTVSSGEVQYALLIAIAQEKKRRAEELKRQYCPSGQSGCAHN